MRGFNSSKINCVTDLLGRYDILFLQEHWLNNNQLATFNCYFPGYCVHGVSAMDSSKILLGRPNGGVLIIYPDTFWQKLSLYQQHRRDYVHYLYICLILYYICFVFICHVILTMIVILMNIIQFYRKFQHYV